MIRGKFEKAKEEVDSDLAIFAADLVGILEKNAESHPEWQETIEDLLILARSCAMTSPNEFWLQCEGIVQDLDDRRQELPPGILKQLRECFSYLQGVLGCYSFTRKVDLLRRGMHSPYASRQTFSLQRRESL